MSRRRDPQAAAPENGAFLIGQPLTDAVRHVLTGQDPRCAVAFWGKGFDAFLDRITGRKKNLRVVCDISMGGCHPEALRSLGAPGNANIRYRDGLHAKVYLSETGVVIGSANASDNGLGFKSGTAGLLEAATFHSAETAMWKAVSAWFEDLHGSALEVDEPALDRAGRLFRPRRGPDGTTSTRPGSLLDMVLANPDLFEDVGFVLASTSSTHDERIAARKSARKAGVEKAIIDAAGDNDLYTGWDEADVLRWPTSFIELWMPRTKLHVWGRTLCGIDPAGGNVIAKKDLRSVRTLLPPDCPAFDDVARLDGEPVGRLVKDGGVVYRNGRQLAAALEALV